MRVLGPAFAVLLAVTVPSAAHANGLGSNMRSAKAGPASNIILAWDGGGSGGRPGAVGAPPPAGQVRQWNRGWVRPHWGQNWNGGWVPRGGPGVPTYWVWGPSGGAFDYPFSDWRGPTGGWGNP
jgi:hypothetical protein